MSLFSKKDKDEKKDQLSAKPAESVLSKKEKKVVELVPADKKIKAENQTAYRVLVCPLLTEKSTILNSLNQYVFIVDKRSHKTAIKKAIEEAYHVTPIKINVINNLGKKVRSGRGKVTSSGDWKKAIVTLPADKKIEIYENT
jgi:large subunit ribosomal protein L23